jgi:uncharacterized protein (DUF427 family)
MWPFHGQARPPFAEVPGPGQESVWDYPRPPRVEADARLVEVAASGTRIASSRACLRVLETASPPTFYLPRSAVDVSRLARMQGSTWCEWKGAATYWALAGVTAAQAIGWSYDDPTPPFEALRGCLSFYPGRVECFVDGERVRPQPGGFYGGWITGDIAGPFKGGGGSAGW